MANTIFRFYSEHPLCVQDFLYRGDRNMRSAVVRFDGRKACGLPVYRITVVLDDMTMAIKFETWLERRSKKVNLVQMGFRMNHETPYRLYYPTFIERFHRGLLWLRDYLKGHTRSSA